MRAAAHGVATRAACGLAQRQLLHTLRILSRPQRFVRPASNLARADGGGSADAAASAGAAPRVASSWRHRRGHSGQSPVTRATVAESLPAAAGSETGGLRDVSRQSSPARHPRPAPASLVADQLLRRCKRVLGSLPWTDREMESGTSRCSHTRPSQLSPLLRAEAVDILYSFHRAAAVGDAVHTAPLLSSVIRLSCIPGTPWAAREVARAFHLFEWSHLSHTDDAAGIGGGMQAAAHAAYAGVAAAVDPIGADMGSTAAGSASITGAGMEETVSGEAGPGSRSVGCGEQLRSEGGVEGRDSTGANFEGRKGGQGEARLGGGAQAESGRRRGSRGDERPGGGAFGGARHDERKKEGSVRDQAWQGKERERYARLGRVRDEGRGCGRDPSADAVHTAPVHTNTVHTGPLHTSSIHSGDPNAPPRRHSSPETSDAEVSESLLRAVQGVRELVLGQGRSAPRGLAQSSAGGEAPSFSRGEAQAFPAERMEEERQPRRVAEERRPERARAHGGAAGDGRSAILEEREGSHSAASSAAPWPTMPPSPALPTCTRCGAPAFFGGPHTGNPMSCAAHRAPAHTRVEPSPGALRTLAAAMLAHPELSPRASSVLGYLLHRLGAPAGIGEQTLLTQLYAERTRAKTVQPGEVAMVGWVLVGLRGAGSGGQGRHDAAAATAAAAPSTPTTAPSAAQPAAPLTAALPPAPLPRPPLRRHRACVNALLFALSSRGAHAAALSLHSTASAAGLPPDANTFLALAASCARVGDTAGEHAVATEARRAGCDVETDPRVVCTLLAGMIRQCDAAGAERHFARCVRHGLQPNQDVYTSLCRALGKGGWVEQAVTAYYNGARAAGAHPDQSPSAVSAVLGACARAGDADLALRLFSELRPHSPALRNPEPYIALLQALARDRFKPGGCVADRTDRGERALSLARDSGVDIDGRCLNALLLCYVHASDAPGAIAACTRWAHPPIRADDATLLRLLEACVRDRRPDLLPDVTRIAAAHKLSFGPAARDLQLRARLAGIGRRPRAAGDEEADLEAALREFDTGGGTGWSFRTRSELAVACARHGRVEAAALLLDQMAERGEEPGPQVEAALMEAYYRAGDVDPEPMVLWRRGARVAGAARAHGTAREGGSRTPGRGRRRGWWGDEEAGVGLVF